MSEKSEPIKATDKERALAMDRAFFMSRLFREPYYSEIMQALNLYSTRDEIAMKQAETDFKNTCRAADLNKKEKDWLWNYLKNFDAQKADWELAAQVRMNW
jgi:hypothetical protein